MLYCCLNFETFRLSQTFRRRYPAINKSAVYYQRQVSQLAMVQRHCVDNAWRSQR